MLDAVDLFAGPGGWDVAAARLGLDVVGIEFDAAACTTRRAASLPTLEADVRDYGPADFLARGLIASPPCQTFSSAGNGAGRAALDTIRDLALRMSQREDIDFSVFDDERTGLVLEPLRWALDALDFGIPFEWLAFEQVATVLPVWESYAALLEGVGYSVATGLLHAEDYGVPQSRRRSVLVARLRPLAAALPTPSCNPVTMAAALGWEPDRYTWAVTGGRTTTRYTRRHPAERPAPPVTGAGNLYVGTEDPDEWRALTVEEASRLQTFPEGYPWAGGKGKRLQQIGNAVPPLLAEAVLSTVTRKEPSA